jgi:tRNA-specific adenosine deaminase 1
LTSKGSTKFKLKVNIKLHFFSSHTPCGDASIFPKSPEEFAGSPSMKRKCEDAENDTKRLKTEAGDIHRTGAKCVPGGKQDSLGEGEDYHTVGLFRTKPGRGERTLSMSCSDKMARWNILGLQSSLLKILMPEPLYLKSVVIGKSVVCWVFFSCKTDCGFCSPRCPFNEKALRRALADRLSQIESADLPPNYCLNKPLLLHADEDDFVHSKSVMSQSNPNVVPCSAGTICHTKLHILVHQNVPFQLLLGTRKEMTVILVSQ